jgi:hypothetical protein
MMESLLCLLTAPSSSGNTEIVRGDISSIAKSETHTNFFPDYNATLEYRRSEHLLSIEGVNEGKVRNVLHTVAIFSFVIETRAIERT